MRKLFILFVELIKYRNKSAIYLLQCNSRILLFSKYACILILILFYYQNCSNPQVNQSAKVESNPTLTYTWSDYQGNRKWKDAKSKCESIGMRLPTISELKDAYDAKLTKSWKESGFFSGSYYWSSTGTRDHYYFFDTRFGGTYNGLYGDYNNEDDLRNEYHFVRCIL